MLATYYNGRRIKTVDAKMDVTHAKVMEIDHAVNGKAPGESSISQDVATIRDKQEMDMPSTPPATSNGDAILPLLREVANDLKELKGQH